ncbi:MAG: cation:proton antiporter [Nanoarchaeota archaeon]|nr:MAG: cation:proton antiporter [Nanoarchaeota archaeon]
MAAITGLGFALAAFLFTAFIAYYISVRLGLTIVVVEIILGIIIGPSFLGVVSYSESIQAVAELGAIFLLFVIGLNINFKEIYTLKNSIIAFCGVIVPFVSGYFLSFIFGYSLIQCMFIGTTLTATSIAITAYVLKELNYLRSPIAKVIIGAAVVDDVLALLILAITTSFSSGSVLSISFKIAIAVSYIFVTILIIPWIQKILLWADKWGRKRGQERAILILAIAIAFAYSAIAELIGLSAIVGAFLAGVTIPASALSKAKEGAEYLEMVFSAIFFVSIGILVNLREVKLSLFLVLFIVVAIFSKIIGCMASSLFYRFKPKEAFLIGVGMVPRGEMALVVGLIGLTSGIIDQTLYGTIIAMTLITTIFSPLVLSTIIGNQTFKY